MADQKIIHPAGRRKKSARTRKLPASLSWRNTVPYLFMGTVFVLGFISLMLVVKGDLALAGRVVLVAMIVAGLEYHFRKYFHGPSSFEDEFSTLSDILCFAVVPGFLIYRLAFRGWGTLGLIGLFVIIFGGILRLSLYKLYNPIKETQGFVGIPITINAAFIALVTQLAENETIDPVFRLGLLTTVIILAFLTVSTIQYPNPAERPLIFLLAAVSVGAIFLGPPVKKAASLLLLVGGAGYIIFAPMGVVKKGLTNRGSSK